MDQLLSDKIHQASDLNRAYRHILNEAKGGRAVLRDTDGEALVILPHERLVALECISSATAAFVTVENAVSHGSGAPVTDVLGLGDWTWLRFLEADDQRTFLEDVRSALVASAHEHDVSGLRRVLDEWEATARSLRDATHREILLADRVGLSDEQYTEVSRPEAAQVDAGAAAAAAAE